MRIRIISHFEERQEDIVDDLLEVCHKLIQLKDITIMYEMQIMKLLSGLRFALVYHIDLL